MKPIIKPLVICLSISLLLILSSCEDPAKPEALYEVERVSLDSRTTQFREWAQNVVATIADNDKDLQTAVELVEKEQQRPLSELETVQFNVLQRKIKDRNNEISTLFEHGDELQLSLFAGFYQYIGKLDSGAQHCGVDDLDIKRIKLPGLANQSAWPELEKAYFASFEGGKALLNSNRNFPCDKFLPTYETLRGEIETKIDSINQLLNSLAF